MIVSRSSVFGLALASTLVGCTNSGTGTGGTSSSSSTSSGATSSTTSTASTSGSATSASTTATSVSSTSTGMQGTCLPASATAAYFSIQTNDLCAIAVYTAPALTLSAFGAVPTWGRQGGPLTSTVMQTATTADLQIERWSLSGTTLMKTTTDAQIQNVSAGAFFTSQLVDLPNGTSAVGWSGMMASTDGKLEIVSDTMSKQTLAATGVFGLASLGPSAAGDPRLLYTGLSQVGGPANNMVGLYFADFKAQGTVSGAVSLWGDANGPVAVDSAGNAIAINTTFTANTQEMRGFEASKIKAAGPSIPGDSLLTTAGFGSALAAVAPTATKSGLALYQPEVSMGANTVSEDVIAVAYTAAMGKLTPMGTAATALKLAQANTSLTLMTDGADHVWVGAPTAGGGTGSTFIVLARP